MKYSVLGLIVLVFYLLVVPLWNAARAAECDPVASADPPPSPTPAVVCLSSVDRELLTQQQVTLDALADVAFAVGGLVVFSLGVLTITASLRR